MQPIFIAIDVAKGWLDPSSPSKASADRKYGKPGAIHKGEIQWDQVSALTQFSGRAHAIAGSIPALAGVGQELHGYTAHASGRSCCRAEHLILALHHACGSASCR
jgi:hypothetical protein